MTRTSQSSVRLLAAVLPLMLAAGAAFADTPAIEKCGHKLGVPAVAEPAVAGATCRPTSSARRPS